jgi:hypothetical protein
VTDGETRGNASAGFLSGFKLRIPRRRRSSTLDASAFALEDAGPFHRTDERPKWLQVLILLALMGLGVTVAWSAKQAVDGHAIIGGSGPTIIQDMSRGLLNSWDKLRNAIH